MEVIQRNGLTGTLLLMGRQTGKTTMLVKMYEGEVAGDEADAVFITANNASRVCTAERCPTSMKASEVFLPQAFVAQESALMGHNMPPLYVFIDEFAYLKPRDEDAVIEAIERIARKRQVRVIGASTAPRADYADCARSPEVVETKLLSIEINAMIERAEPQVKRDLGWIQEGLGARVADEPKRRIVDHSAFTVLKADVYHETIGE